MLLVLEVFVFEVLVFEEVLLLVEVLLLEVLVLEVLLVLFTAGDKVIVFWLITLLKHVKILFC